MTRAAIVLVLSFIGVTASAQVTIYYDAKCGITMNGLHTHYRVAAVDTASRRFVGEVRDYWSNDAPMLSMVYDSSGVRNGRIVVWAASGKVRLEGQYVESRKSGVWNVYGPDAISVDFDKKSKSQTTVDSLEASLNCKDNFTAGQFIRRKDYPEIYSLLSDIRIQKERSNEVYTIVEQAAVFPGGIAMLGEFINAFIKYPEEALKNDIKGKVIIAFTVTEDGSTDDFQVAKGIGFGCDEEAIRVLKLCPDWIPGYQRGKAVKVRAHIPITFAP